MTNSTAIDGMAIGVAVPITPGRYRCIEARDPLHTLRSWSDITFDGTQYLASFVDDPEYGGNWLIGGNLNADEVIDILDEGIYKAALLAGVSYPTGDTTCDTEAPHSDISGDGLVTSLDHVIIVENFLASDKFGCWKTACEDLGDTDGDGVVTCCDPCPRDNPDDTDGDGVCDSYDVCPGVDDNVFGPECEDAIPAVSQWGVVILGLLLLTVAKISFGRRAMQA